MLWNDDHLNEYTDLCGRRCLRLLRSERGESKLSAYIRERCNGLFALNKHLHWPGEKPIALTRARLPQLWRNRYFVAPKTDGERHWLVFGRSADYRYVFIALVNTKYDVFLIQLKSAECLFQWTVLDGELICKDDKWTFLVFDCLCFRGMNLTSWHFENRLQVARATVEMIESSDSSTFEVAVKSFFVNGSTTREEVEESAQGFKVDGYIFVKNHAPVVPFFSSTTFKLKPNEKATADFFFGITPDSSRVELVVVGEVSNGIPQPSLYCAQDFDRTNRKCAQNQRIEQMDRERRKGNRIVPGYSLEEFCPACAESKPITHSMSMSIMECVFCPKDKLWKPCRPRSDKGYPNKRITVDEARQSVFENISFDECNRYHLAASDLCCSQTKSELKPSCIKDRIPWGLYVPKAQPIVKSRVQPTLSPS